MKILIAGCGKVGDALVRQLSADGYDLTVIDSNQQKLEALVEHYDVMALHGNCASMETLRQAGVENAELLIVTTGSDEINMLCTMTAHGLNPRIHTVARIRNPEYTQQAYTMGDVFGLSLAFNPEKQAAVEIQRLLQYPGFLKRDVFAKGRVEIVELRIDTDSKLAGVPLSQMNSIIKCRVLVCAVLRDGTAVTPDGQFVLQSGDRIFVTAPSHDLSLLLKNLGIVSHKVRQVVIAGGGSVSYYLAEALAEQRVDVTIIEKSQERCLRLAELLPDAKIICGDASNQSLLESEGLANADALVTLTSTDALNVIISMYGNSCGLPQIITKLDRLDDARIIDRLPVGSIICPKKLSSGTLIQYVRAMQNQTGAAVTVHTIADGNAEAMEFIMDDTSLHCGQPLKELKLKKNIRIACITHHGKIDIPGGDSTFRKGDSVVIVVSGEDVILQFNDIFA